MNEKTQNNIEEKEAKGGKGKIKKILYPLLFAVVIIGCCVGYYLFSVSRNYFSTDNAKVTAKLYSVMPVTSGKLISWDVENGDLVEQDQVLGRQEVLPYITSPITGTVVKNEGAVNQVVSAGTQLAVIADTSNLYIGVNVEETDIMKIRLGQIVDIKIDAYPHRTFKGQVTEIDPATQTYFSNTTSFSTSGTYTKVTQLIPIKVTIENQEELPLVFGMNATVKIHLK
ncbi:MAG: efflux RND transporter periplasmic adaptor subunit [Enterocloster asparagiformis]|nr:efflux RND transporter periplasmic adaptor subunit [Enterocloster asparagiformis]